MATQQASSASPAGTHGDAAVESPAVPHAAQPEPPQPPPAVVLPAPEVPVAPQALVTPAALLELPSGPLGIPGAVLIAYRTAADELAVSQPGCHLPWTLLAGIGRIESGHAAGGRVDANGTTLGPILGPLLDGTNPGDGVVLDTDHGHYDGNTTYDRAVGPMQFLPSTWAAYGADGNHDGVADPNNVYDAALGAGRYLCSGGLDVADPAQARTAVYRYNHSDAYVANVLAWSAAYAHGVAPTDSVPGTIPTDHPAPTTPPAPTTTTARVSTTPLPTSTTPPVTTTRPPASTTPAPVTTTPAPASTTPAPVTTTPAPASTTPPVTTTPPPTSSP